MTPFHILCGQHPPPFHPFYILCGQHPPPFHPFILEETKIAELEEQLLNQDAMLQILQFNLLKAQSQMMTEAGSKRRDISFELSDWVFLRVHPYKQKSLAKRMHEKLSSCFFGPYNIIPKVGPVAYELQLPPSSKLHPIFHVSLLQPAKGDFSASTLPALPINVDWELIMEPEKVLVHCWSHSSSTPSLE